MSIKRSSKVIIVLAIKYNNCGYGTITCVVQGPIQNGNRIHPQRGFMISFVYLL